MVKLKTNTDITLAHCTSRPGTVHSTIYFDMSVNYYCINGKHDVYQ